jgi:hypothetical protein
MNTQSKVDLRKATARPLTVRANDATGYWDLLLDGAHVAELESESTAHELAQAVNSYDAMREALEAILNIEPDDEGVRHIPGTRESDVMDKVRAALE